MFVKLFTNLLQSSLWEEDSDTRIVWLTLLMMADQDGFVHAVPSAIARFARVSDGATVAALEKFQGPDSMSRTVAEEGRRIEKIEGGYLILNYRHYRALRDTAEVREKTRKRVAAYRARKKEPVTLRNVTVTQSNDIAEAEAEAEAETTNPVSEITQIVEREGHVTKRDNS